jgi:hypothetical protein
MGLRFLPIGSRQQAGFLFDLFFDPEDGGSTFLQNTVEHLPLDYKALQPRRQHSTPGLSNAAPIIYFPGALLYSAGFNVNQNLKKKYF